jgi:F-box protein 21
MVCYDSGSSTLPMSLVCIFCAIAHRLGLKASILNFPSRILARVEGWMDVDDDQPEYVIDVFEHGQVLSETEIADRLRFIGIPQSSARNFLHSATPSEIITRVGRNIIESLTREEGGIVGSNDNSRSAHAAVAALLFVQPMVDALPNILYQFPMDVFSIERDYIPIVQREGVEGLLMADRLRATQRSILERDSQTIQPRIRAQEIDPEKGDNKNIEYHIGTVFRHRRWGYIGVIKRWDPRCCADEIWVQGNNVDSLDNGGRHQPFYSISADDGSDRYIAQINIIPMKTVHISTFSRLITMHENIGGTFARADPERGLFIMDESHKRKYPEDAAWQQDILSRPVQTV